MKSENFILNEIQESCEKEYQKYNQWEELLESSYMEVANSIYGDMRNVIALDRVSSPEDEDEEVSEHIQSLLWLFDLNISLFADGYIQTTVAIKENIKLFWSSKNTTPQPTLVLQVIFANLTNTLLSIRSLLLSGFPGQASVLLRWFIELADTLVALTVDEKTFDSYIDTKGNPSDYSVWRGSLTPSKIRKVINAFHTNSGLQADVVAEINDLREETYQNLSTFTHASWVGQSISSMSENPHNSNIIFPIVGSSSLNNSRSAVRTTLLFSWIIWLELEHLFINSHSWHPDPSKSPLKFSQQASHSLFFVRLKVFRRLFLKYRQNIEKIK